MYRIREDINGNLIVEEDPCCASPTPNPAEEFLDLNLNPLRKLKADIIKENQEDGPYSFDTLEGIHRELYRCRHQPEGVTVMDMSAQWFFNEVYPLIKQEKMTCE